MFYSLRGQGSQYLTNIYMLPWLKSNHVAVAPDIQLLFSIILNLFTIFYIYLDTSRAAVEKPDINIQENNWSSRMQLFLYQSFKAFKIPVHPSGRNDPKLKKTQAKPKEPERKIFRLHAIKQEWQHNSMASLLQAVFNTSLLGYFLEKHSTHLQFGLE